MSYHAKQSPIVPLRTLAQLYMFEPGHPRVPAGATHVRVVSRRGAALVLDFFDAKGRCLGRVEAKWAQTGPVAPNFKTQPWWTTTAYWGPVVTPEAEVGPVRMARPPFDLDWDARMS